MTGKLLDIISKKYPLKELDIGDDASLKANGMKFSVRAYKADGLGHVSVMRAKGFFGLMRMDTLIINPSEIDLPIYSYDRIFAMGNDTLIVELYDTLVGGYDPALIDAVNQRYSFLPERDPGKHWYDSIKLPQSISKKGKAAETGAFDTMTLEHFEAYLSLPVCSSFDVSEKQRKAEYYVNGLLKNGGPSTDVFKKTLGEERTGHLFTNVLFGI